MWALIFFFSPLLSSLSFSFSFPASLSPSLEKGTQKSPGVLVPLGHGSWQMKMEGNQRQ